MKTIKTVLGEVYSENSAKLNDLIGNNKDFNIVGETKDGLKLIELIREKEPDLLIISKDITSQNSKAKTAHDFCKVISSEFPALTIIMTSLDEEEEDDLRNAMRAGAKDFIAGKNIETKLLYSIIDLIDTKAKFGTYNGDKRGRVLCMLSAKGGAGKTTLSFNLAADIAQKLANLQEGAKVLLIDYDLQFGDISYISTLKPKRTIADLNELEDIDKEALEAHLLQHPVGKFWILPAPLKPHFSDFIKPETIRKILQIAKKNFDFIIVDCMQGFNKASILAIQSSDFSTVVANPSLVGLKNAKITLDTLEELLETSTEVEMNTYTVEEINPKDKMKLLLNEFDNNSIPLEDLSRSFSKYNIIGCVTRNDNIVSQAVRDAQFVVLNYPNSNIAKDIKAIADKLLEESGYQITTNKKDKKSKQKGKSTSLFVKLFSK